MKELFEKEVFTMNDEVVDMFELQCTIHQIIDFYLVEHQYLLTKDEVLEELKNNYNIIKK